MHKTAGNEDGITRRDRHPGKQLLKPSLLDRLLKFGGTHPRLQARKNTRARIRIQHIPRLRLRFAAPLHGGTVIRMHLHAQALPRINQLDQQRKSSRSDACAHQSASPLRNRVFQRAAFQHPVANDAHAVIAIGNLPRLRIDSRGLPSIILPDDPVAAPDVIFVHRLKKQWIKRAAHDVPFPDTCSRHEARGASVNLTGHVR